jgi:hypothetical protein
LPIYRPFLEETSDPRAWLWKPPRRRAWRRLYSRLVPWADDYTTFVWATTFNAFGDEIPIEEATFDQLRVKKIRVRPRRDHLLDADGTICGYRCRLDDDAQPEWTAEEQRLLALLMDQLRAFWAQETERARGDDGLIA